MYDFGGALDSLSEMKNRDLIRPVLQETLVPVSELSKWTSTGAEYHCKDNDSTCTRETEQFLYQNLFFACYTFDREPVQNTSTSIDI